MAEVKLPELGENIEGAQVLSVLVSPGDTVTKDQPIIELETDKATAEVPADADGVVREILVKEGDQIAVGQTILILESSSGASAPPAPKAEPREKPRAETPKPAPEATPKTEAPVAAKTETAPPEPEPASAEPRPDLRLIHESPRTAASDPVPAPPRIRRLARELGIDIAQVPGTGPAGRITEQDVKAFARSIISGSHGGATASPVAAPGAAPAVPPLPDFSKWGETEREPATRIRRVTAEVMSTSWSVIPHVTQHDRADITELEAWRKEYSRKNPEPKVTVTAIVVKAVAAALRKFPTFNASYDAHTAEIVFKKYVNVGVAVDTDRGLLVPTVFGADAKGIKQIAADITDLAGKARDRKISVDELSGANINVSNLGGLGTTAFSPIVAWPQVAVIGIGRGRLEAEYRDGAFVPRLMLPMSVSYDHRIIDGADAARFLRWIAEVLEQPLTLVMEG